MRIHIVCGHYGSGKTEFAINLALKLKQQYNKVKIIDIDTVNPYFRTADAKGYLEEHGITAIIPEFANTNVDLPSLPPEIFSAFSDKESAVVFDVGGDDEGAIALGQYNRFFREEDYAMYFIHNARRLLTSTLEESLAMMRDIEATSRLHFTSIVANTNLQGETTREIIEQGLFKTEELSKASNVPIQYICGFHKDSEKVNFLMKNFMKLPF